MGPQQSWYQTCSEAVDPEKCATPSRKNLLLRIAKSSGLIFSDLATFTSCTTSMLMIYCTERVLSGANPLAVWAEGPAATSSLRKHQSNQLGWTLLLLRMQYGHTRQEPQYAAPRRAPSLPSLHKFLSTADTLQVAKQDW